MKEKGKLFAGNLKKERRTKFTEYIIHPVLADGVYINPFHSSSFHYTPLFSGVLKMERLNYVCSIHTYRRSFSNKLFMVLPCSVRDHDWQRSHVPGSGKNLASGFLCKYCLSHPKAERMDLQIGGPTTSPGNIMYFK